MSIAKIAAPAKINLYLRVAPPAADGPYQGFHPLLSWMTTIGLFDTLTFSPLESAAATKRTANEALLADPLRLTCQLSADMPALACDRSNLIVRAGSALSSAAMEAARNPRAQGTKPSGDAPPISPQSNISTREEQGKEQGKDSSSAASIDPLAVLLQKRIPMGAGLGGGSSNAAATLIALNRLWRFHLDRQRLMTIALALGSDVPFFVSGIDDAGGNNGNGGGSICRGRGEFMRPAPALKTARWAAVFLPPWGMPTPAVYKRYDEMHLGGMFDKECGGETQPPFETWAALPAAQLMKFLVNDLESPAFSLSPRLGLLRREIEARLGRIVRMSGSGSSLFTLFDSREQAEIACQRVQSAPLRRMQGLDAAKILTAAAVEISPAPRSLEIV